MATVCSLVGLFLIAYVSNAFLNSRTFTTKPHRIDCTCIGRYDYISAYSLYVWCYMAFVYNYRNKGTLHLHEELLEWNNNNKDQDGMFYNAIERAYTKFLHKVEHKQLFGVPMDWDPASVTVTLKYNDYLDIESMINKLSEVSHGSEEQHMDASGL